MTTDYKKLCAELTEELEDLHCHYDIPSQSALIKRARAALGKDEPSAPESREPVAVTGQPTYNELYDFFNQHTSEYMKMYANEAPSFMRAVLARWGNLKAGVTSSTPAPGEGEVAELTDKLVEAAPALAEMGWDQHAQRILRAAELLQRQALVPEVK